jgi:integrase
MKSGKFFRIPLTKPALEIIYSLREYSESDYIFANERTGKMMSENAMNLVLHRLGYKGVATTHGMRSTLRDWAGETTNFSERIVEVCLAHTVNGAVEAAYQRGDYMEKRKIIMKGWADFCYPPIGKVVPINTQFNKTS